MSSLSRPGSPVQPPAEPPVRFPECVMDLYPRTPAESRESFADDLTAAIGPDPIAPPPAAAPDAPKGGGL